MTLFEMLPQLISCPTAVAGSNTDLCTWQYRARNIVDGTRLVFECKHDSDLDFHFWNLFHTDMNYYWVVPPSSPNSGEVSAPSMETWEKLAQKAAEIAVDTVFNRPFSAMDSRKGTDEQPKNSS